MQKQNHNLFYKKIFILFAIIFLCRSFQINAHKNYPVTSPDKLEKPNESTLRDLGDRAIISSDSEKKDCGSLSFEISSKENRIF